MKPKFELKKITVYSLPLMLSAVANYLVTWTDILMLGALLSNNAKIGQYQAAFQTTAMLGFILYSVNSVFPSIASGLYHNGDRKRLTNIYKSTTKWTGGFTILGSLYLVTYSSQVMSIFGNEFDGVKPMIAVLCVGYIANAVAGPAGYLLSMSQYERVESANTIVTALSNIVLNYILISQYGIIGAAVATGTSLVLLNTLRVSQASYLLGIRPGFSSIIKIVPGIMVSGIIFVSIKFIYPSSLIAALGAGVVGSLAFISVVYLFLFSERDQLLFESLS